MDRFSKIIEDIKGKIREIISNPKKMPLYMSIEQLKMTVDELNKMDQIRDTKQFMPYYPKGINDCWDFNDELGKELLAVVDIYMKLYNYKEN